MQRAKITNKDGYRCAPEGHTVVTIPFGDIIEGDMAKAAIASRDAQALGPQKKAKGKSSETKAKGAAPENKAAS